MISLTTSMPWGPMAMAVTGRRIIATLLAILLASALYASGFRVQPGPPMAIE